MFFYLTVTSSFLFPISFIALHATFKHIIDFLSCGFLAKIILSVIFAVAQVLHVYKYIYIYKYTRLYKSMTCIPNKMLVKNF